MICSLKIYFSSESPSLANSANLKAWNLLKDLRMVLLSTSCLTANFLGFCIRSVLSDNYDMVFACLSFSFQTTVFDKFEQCSIVFCSTKPSSVDSSSLVFVLTEIFLWQGPLSVLRNLDEIKVGPLFSEFDPVLKPSLISSSNSLEL